MKHEFFFLLSLVCLDVLAGDYSFRLKNELGFSRQGETVEVAVPESLVLDNMTLSDEEGRTLPFELCGQHAIRFQAFIAHGATMGYVLREGVRQQPKKLTYAAIKAPQSRSDIAWENDRGAFRMYSSVLLGSEPNTGNGVDMWSKKKSTPVIDDMYNLSNYHVESEYGVDAFSVNGKRLGNGGVSHVVDGKLVVHAPHDRCDVEENGALQSRFRLTYNNIKVDGVTYTKTVHEDPRCHHFSRQPAQQGHRLLYPRAGWHRQADAAGCSAVPAHRYVGSV